MCRCAERQPMRKTAAPAAVEARSAVFRMARAELFHIFLKEILTFPFFRPILYIVQSYQGIRFIPCSLDFKLSVRSSQGVVLVSTGILKMEKLSAGDASNRRLKIKR